MRRVAANDAALVELHWEELEKLGGVHDEEMGALAAKLPGNTSLQLLNFTGLMTVTDEGWQALSKDVARTDIVAVHLRKTKVYLEKATAAKIRAATVANAQRRLVADDAELKVLPWHHFRDLDRSDFEVLTEALKHNTRLQSLQLAGNSQVIDDRAEELLLPVLPRCGCVTVSLQTTGLAPPQQDGCTTLACWNAASRLAANDPHRRTELGRNARCRRRSAGDHRRVGEKLLAADAERTLGRQAV